MTAGVQYRTAIPPVTGSGERPLWSVVIPTHNRADHLRETLASFLDVRDLRRAIEINREHSAPVAARFILPLVGWRGPG